jgi:hypothetical protein
VDLRGGAVIVEVASLRNERFFTIFEVTLAGAEGRRSAHDDIDAAARGRHQRHRP